jgi:hypothetical protein
LQYSKIADLIIVPAPFYDSGLLLAGWLVQESVLAFSLCSLLIRVEQACISSVITLLSLCVQLKQNNIAEFLF